MTIKGQPKHFHHKYRFELQIDNLGSAAFQSCSELKVEIAKIEYYEGGRLTPIKEPGRMTFADLTIERAATTDADLYTWLQITANAASDVGFEVPTFKRGGSIVQKDRDGDVLRRWHLFGLWPTSFTAGAWDNNSDEFTMEQVVLAYDYFKMFQNVKGARDVADVANIAKRVIGQ
jgi:phage tail-like protein